MSPPYDIPGMEPVGAGEYGGESLTNPSPTAPAQGLTAPAALTFWDDRTAPLEWERIYLAGELWPGSAEVSGAGVGRKIDVQKEKGTDGASLKDEGYDPARLTITLRITTDAEWQRLQELLPLIHPRKKGGARAPVEICYPSVNLLGITQIYIDKIPIPSKPSADDGVLVIELSAIEWFPEQQPVKKGAGKGANGVDQAATGAGGATIYDVTGDGYFNQPTSELIDKMAGDNTSAGANGPSDWII